MSHIDYMITTENAEKYPFGKDLMAQITLLLIASLHINYGLKNVIIARIVDDCSPFRFEKLKIDRIFRLSEAKNVTASF